jgi:hypothetical protein
MYMNSYEDPSSDDYDPLRVVKEKFVPTEKLIRRFPKPRRKSASVSDPRCALHNVTKCNWCISRNLFKL